jgi:transcriptional regulator with XRE-family HTH domain
MNNKIKNILLMKDMSPSRFADEIGVQRSSISHILSGRNKPSLEIIQKIVRRFPELGLDWIIDEDEEESLEQPESSSNKSTLPSSQETSAKTIAIPLQNLQPEENEINATGKRQVEKILIFYSDKTFTEYKPE